MIRRLVARSFLQAPGRSALLLVGYALGVGVTVALLSIGAALLEQSRDRALVGGGDLIVLPAGLDVETFRTGGVSSLYASVDRARFLYRQVLAGPRLEGRIGAAAPWVDDELLYLEAGDTTLAVSGAGQIPSLARALGAGPELEEGSWEDLAADERWTSPSDSALYAEIDAFHLPEGAARGDSTWAEWHYFNVLLPDGAGWLYLTYMVAGAVPDGRWGGRVLATLVTADGGGEPVVRSYERDVGPAEVAFSLDRPDLRIGASTVALDPAGRYRLAARLPGPRLLRLELRLSAPERRYLPPLEVAPGDFASGYVVPMLDARADGEVCAGSRCWTLEGSRAYHDHNWGVWRDVTWDWGQARAGPYSLLYGGVTRSEAGVGTGAATGPDVAAARGTDAIGGRFAFLADSLGFAGLLTLDTLRHRWAGGGEDRRPIGLRFRASGLPGELAGEVDVEHARWSPGGGVAADAPEADAVRRFWQMRGTVDLRGVLIGDSLAVAGEGFFETWTSSRTEGPTTDPSAAGPTATDRQVVEEPADGAARGGE